MADLGGFNPADIPPDERDTLEPVPPGRYDMQVEDSELVEAKSGRGHILKLTHKIVSGPYENRKLWSQHNFRHENAMAQQIGLREIANLCRAIGHEGPLQDSLDLHGIPFVGRVTVEKQGDYEPRNVIKAFLPPNGAPPAASAFPARPATAQALPRQQAVPRQQTAPRQQAAPPVGGAGKPSWMNRAATR
jgi:hypothetical protein